MAPWLKSDPHQGGASIQLQAACQIDFAQMAVKFRNNTFNYAINCGKEISKTDFLGSSVQKSNA
jgi:hypothetical protein